MNNSSPPSSSPQTTGIIVGVVAIVAILAIVSFAAREWLMQSAAPPEPGTGTQINVLNSSSGTLSY